MLSGSSLTASQEISISQWGIETGSAGVVMQEEAVLGLGETEHDAQH